MATPPVSFNSLAVEIITEIWTSLPRKSKSDILSVSRAWNTHARSIPYMWTDILFGEGSSMNDLTVAHKWLVHSGNLNLTVIILRPAGEKVSNGLTVDTILEVLAPARDQLQHLQIHAADTDVNFVQTFMMTGTFSALKFVDTTLHRHWLSIIRDEPIPASTLAVHPVVFHALNFPRLSAMCLSHIPPFWPSLLPTCDHLTQIVLGPHVEGFEPSLTELKHALESATSLTHLGFYRAMPLIDESALAANFSMILSALTSLSLRHVQPVSLRRIMAILTIPSFSSLTIAPDEGQLTPDADGENDINLLVEQLHAPEFAHRLRTLNIQTFHYQFSYGGLTEEFWYALMDPATGSARYLPTLAYLSLVDISPVHVQELLNARTQQNHPPLEKLSLILALFEAKNARTPRWSAWLQGKVETLTIIDYTNKKRYNRLRPSFEV